MRQQTALVLQEMNRKNLEQEEPVSSQFTLTIPDEHIVEEKMKGSDRNEQIIHSTTAKRDFEKYVSRAKK